MTQFNPKSPLEFAFNLVQEESSEIIQSVGKITRFSLHHKYPRTGTSNIDHLQQEIYDFVACVKQLNAELAEHDLPQLRLYDEKAVRAKLDKIQHYADISIVEGMLASRLAPVKLNVLSGME